MRILLVDDHTLIVDALRQLLLQLDPEITCISAATAEEGLAAVAHYPDFDLVLLDLALPDGDGLSVLRRLGELATTTPVVVVAASVERADVFAALDLGAVGYIPKTLSGQDMLAALRLILKGEIYVPSHLLIERRSLKPDVSGHDHSVEYVLTPRQMDVLRELGEGNSNKVIARKLGLAEGTVKIHVGKVMEVLGAKNRVEVVVLAQRRGLLSVEIR